MKVTLLCAVAAGVILGWPHLRADFAYLQADEWRYAVNTEAVRGGNWTYSDVYLYEHQEATWPYPRLEGWITGILAKAVGGTDRLYVLSDFVLPPVIFFGMVVILSRLGLPRAVSLLAASVYILHHTDLYYLIEHGWRHSPWPLLRWYLWPAANDSILGSGAHTFARFPHPLLPRLAEAGFFLALGARRRVVAGALLGLITYLRYHDWMVLYPALAFAVAVLWFRKERAEAKALAAVTAIGLVLALPTLLPGLTQSADPAVKEGLLHRGVQYTRALLPVELGFLFPAGPICLLLLAGGAAVMRVRTPGRLAFAAGVVGLLWGCTSQVLTGFTVVAGHWHLQHVLPIFTTAVAIAAGLLCFRFLPKAAPWIVGAVVALSFGHAAILFGRYQLQPGYQAELRRALTDVEPGAVVCTFQPFELKTVAPDAFSFLTNATFSPVATEELLTRYLMARKLFGAAPAEIEGLFIPGWHQHLGRLVAGDQFFRYSPFGEPPTVQNTFPPEWRERWMAFYAELPDDPVARIRGRFKIDYVLVVPGEPVPARTDRWTPVFKGERVTLYRLP